MSDPKPNLTFSTCPHGNAAIQHCSHCFWEYINDRHREARGE